MNQTDEKSRRLAAFLTPVVLRKLLNNQTSHFIKTYNAYIASTKTVQNSLLEPFDLYLEKSRIEVDGDFISYLGLYFMRSRTVDFSSVRELKPLIEKMGAQLKKRIDRSPNDLNPIQAYFEEFECVKNPLLFAGHRILTALLIPVLRNVYGKSLNEALKNIPQNHYLQIDDTEQTDDQLSVQLMKEAVAFTDTIYDRYHPDTLSIAAVPFRIVMIAERLSHFGLDQTEGRIHEIAKSLMEEVLFGQVLDKDDPYYKNIASTTNGLILRFPELVDHEDKLKALIHEEFVQPSLFASEPSLEDLKKIYRMSYSEAVKSMNIYEVFESMCVDPQQYVLFSPPSWLSDSWSFPKEAIPHNCKEILSLRTGFWNHDLAAKLTNYQPLKKDQSLLTNLEKILQDYELEDQDRAHIIGLGILRRFWVMKPSQKYNKNRLNSQIESIVKHTFSENLNEFRLEKFIKKWIKSEGSLIVGKLRDTCREVLVNRLKFIRGKYEEGCDFRNLLTKNQQERLYRWGCNHGGSKYFWRRITLVEIRSMMTHLAEMEKATIDSALVRSGVLNASLGVNKPVTFEQLGIVGFKLALAVAVSDGGVITNSALNEVSVRLTERLNDILAPIGYVGVGREFFDYSKYESELPRPVNDLVEVTVPLKLRNALQDISSQYSSVDKFWDEVDVKKLFEIIANCGTEESTLLNSLAAVLYRKDHLIEQSLIQQVMLDMKVKLQQVLAPAFESVHWLSGAMELERRGLIGYLLSQKTYNTEKILPTHLDEFVKAKTTRLKITILQDVIKDVYPLYAGRYDAWMISEILPLLISSLNREEVLREIVELFNWSTTLHAFEEFYFSQVPLVKETKQDFIETVFKKLKDSGVNSEELQAKFIYLFWIEATLQREKMRHKIFTENTRISHKKMDDIYYERHPVFVDGKKESMIELRGSFLDKIYNELPDKLKTVIEQVGSLHDMITDIRGKRSNLFYDVKGFQNQKFNCPEQLGIDGNRSGTSFSLPNGEVIHFGSVEGSFDGSVGLPHILNAASGLSYGNKDRFCLLLGCMTQSTGNLLVSGLFQIPNIFDYLCDRNLIISDLNTDVSVYEANDTQIKGSLTLGKILNSTVVRDSHGKSAPSAVMPMVLKIQTPFTIETDKGGRSRLYLATENPIMTFSN